MRASSPCIKLVDGSVRAKSSAWLAPATESRDPAALHARLSRQFVGQNAQAFRTLDLDVEIVYDGRSVQILFRSGTRIGAVPLVSPTSGQPTLGLVVQPRFGWDGIGPVMGHTGWRVVPRLLKLPMLPRSARDIPQWVLSAVVLLRLKQLLDQLSRRFELMEVDRPAPRGSVDWTEYALSRIPRAGFQSIPCRFPELRDDRSLAAAVHYALRRHMQSLETQRGRSSAVLRLLDFCDDLLRRVSHVPAVRPSPLSLQKWANAPVRAHALREGIEAIEWTVEDRGLAGLTDLQGLPWAMSMEEFFEAWIEDLAHAVSARIGGGVRTGRQYQTVTPISWEPPFRGSQRSLRPDVIIDAPEHTILMDAKYKAHGQELGVTPWSLMDEAAREQHRIDLLQVLAYANLSERERTTAVLAYPCRAEAWDSQFARGETYHRAEIQAGRRRITVLLFNVPLSVERMTCVSSLLARLILRG